jgi:hypothetical protein
VHDGSPSAPRRASKGPFEGDPFHRGRVAVVAAGLLVLLAVTELVFHQPRDADSYRAGYSAGSHASRTLPFADARAGSTMCDALLENALYDSGATKLNHRDFHAGCTQAVRDGIE